MLFVRLSSDRVRQAMRQDCSFAKKQASPPALLVVVLSERLVSVSRDARSVARSSSALAPGGSINLRVPSSQRART
jgi:hypothetical protein